MSTEPVFICYSNKDVAFANTLAKDLIKAGVNVWIDSIHGQDDDDLKEAAIKSSKLALIVTSENALNDASLKQEKDFARDNNVERMLLKIEPCDTASKMRWKKLPTIDFSINKVEGMNMLFQKLKLDDQLFNQDLTSEITATPQAESNTSQRQSPETIVPQEKSEKEGLLVTQDEIATVRSMYENQLKNTQIAIGFFIVASAAIILVLVFRFDYIGNLFSSEKAADVASTAENAYDKVTKFIPGVAAVLPNAFGGVSWRKMKDKKNRISVINRLERKRDRMASNLNEYTKEQILSLETELENLITI